MNNMGMRIKLKRLEKGMTMEELANALGVKASAINKYEKGIVENIKRSTIKLMSEIFECDPAWLMGFDEEAVAPVQQTEFDDFEMDLISSFRNADPETQKVIINLLAFSKKMKSQEEE